MTSNATNGKAESILPKTYTCCRGKLDDAASDDQPQKIPDWILQEVADCLDCEYFPSRPSLHDPVLAHALIAAQFLSASIIDLSADALSEKDHARSFLAQLVALQLLATSLTSKPSFGPQIPRSGTISWTIPTGQNIYMISALRLHSLIQRQNLSGGHHARPNSRTLGSSQGTIPSPPPQEQPILVDEITKRKKRYYKSQNSQCFVNEGSEFEHELTQWMLDGASDRLKSLGSSALFTQPAGLNLSDTESRVSTSSQPVSTGKDNETVEEPRPELKTRPRKSKRERLKNRARRATSRSAPISLSTPSVTFKVPLRQRISEGKRRIKVKGQVWKSTLKRGGERRFGDQHRERIRARIKKRKSQKAGLKMQQLLREAGDLARGYPRSIERDA